MNFEIGSAFRAGALYVLGGDVPAALLHFTSDGEKRLQLRCDACVFKIDLDGLDKRFVPSKVVCGDRTVDALTVAAIVLR